MDPSKLAIYSSTMIVESTSLQALQSNQYYCCSKSKAIQCFAFVLTWCDSLQTMRKPLPASFSGSFLEEQSWQVELMDKETFRAPSSQ